MSLVMEPDTQHIGKWFIVIGACIALASVLLCIGGHLGLYKLPGDLQIFGRNWKIYFPLATCILLSVFLTLIFWLIRFSKNRHFGSPSRLTFGLVTGAESRPFQQTQYSSIRLPPSLLVAL